MRDAAGGRHLPFGHYREIAPPSRPVFTWSCPELNVIDSVVTLDLSESGAGTELCITHELPPIPMCDAASRRLDGLHRQPGKTIARTSMKEF